MKTRYVKIPNAIILDRDLRPSSKRVYVALLSCRRNDSTVHKTYAELASLSGCSTGTVCSALTELTQRGYVFTDRKYRPSKGLGTVVRDTNVYTLNHADCSCSYTLIPCKLLKLHITHAAFLVALYVLKLMGMGKRAWASLRKGFQKELALSRTTICAAIRQLIQCNALVRLRCLKANRSYSCSTFIMLLWGESVQTQECLSFRPETPDESMVDGGSFFEKHPIINQITGWTYYAEKIRFCYLRKIFLKQECGLVQNPRPP